MHFNAFQHVSHQNIKSTINLASIRAMARGGAHTVLLRSDGSAVATGNNHRRQCNIPNLNAGVVYAQVSAGGEHTVLLCSDGIAVAIGNNGWGQCNIPNLNAGVVYAQVSAGGVHTVLLRSDGIAVAIGNNGCGQCNIPNLNAGVVYAQVSAGGDHTVLLRSDGSAVAIGEDLYEQCSIPSPKPGLRYISDWRGGTDLALQLEIVGENDEATLKGSTLAGEERFCLTARSVDLAWETHKRIARELTVSLQNLQLVLPDGQLLAKFCRANPGASLADATPCRKRRRLPRGDAEELRQAQPRFLRTIMLHLP